MKSYSVSKILFDLDGTLVNTARDLHEATNHCMRHVGRNPVKFELLKPLTGFGAIRLLTESLIQTGGLNGINPNDLRKKFLQFYTENICVHSHLYEGAEALLDYLDSQNIPYGICSNKPHQLTIALLKELGIVNRFKSISGGDSFPYKKPDPRHLIETAKRIPGSGSFLMIGDASPDINAAKAAGAICIAVDYGYPDIPLEKQEPDMIISNLAELIPILIPATS